MELKKWREFFGRKQTVAGKESIIIPKLRIISNFILTVMHKEILTPAQTRLLPLLRQFSKDFYLVGGTAIALHIGHRQSIDFDLFTAKEFDNAKVKRAISKEAKINQIMRDEKGQYTILIGEVHMTFFQYPFDISARHWLDRIVKMPDVLTLAAMKAYALGRRAKWKDYVDLYFVMKKYHSIAAIAEKASAIFGREFNEKLFREQISYFDDINYSEEVTYLSGFDTKDAVIKRALVNWSLSRE